MARLNQDLEGVMEELGNAQQAGEKAVASEMEAKEALQEMAAKYECLSAAAKAVLAQNEAFTEETYGPAGKKMDNLRETMK